MNKHVVVGLLALALTGCTQVTADPVVPTVAVASSVALNGVVADGRVIPVRDVTLKMTQAGTVAEILVAEGATVIAGQALVRLDGQALTLRRDQAQAGLLRAQAKYDQLKAGATGEAIAVAEALVSKAQAAAAQVDASVSDADIAAAQAQLTEAQQALETLRNPSASDRAVAEAAVQKARANLEQQRATLSAAKTTAHGAMEQAVQGLTQAQITYSSSKDNWQYVVDNDRDPFATNKKLSDAQKQTYYDAMLRAESAMRVAEVQLHNARVAYETAQQNEQSGVAAAEATVRDAQTRLDQITNPDAQHIATAEARVAAAEATLIRLQGRGRQAQRDLAKADVAVAQAQLAQTATDPRAVDLAVAAADVESARVAVAQAQYDLDQATITAPFAGTVAQLNLTVGEYVTPATPAVVVADTSAWLVETDDLTELDVVQVHVGDAVNVRFDAIPDLKLAGAVQGIEALGQNRQGDIVYTVRVDLPQSDARLRWNMTATIEVAP
jgi:HlyD family secretion protein